MSTSFGTAGMVHSVSGRTRGVQVKLWDPLRTRAIPMRFGGVEVWSWLGAIQIHVYLTLPYPLELGGAKFTKFEDNRGQLSEFQRYFSFPICRSIWTRGRLKSNWDPKGAMSLRFNHLKLLAPPTTLDLTGSVFVCLREPARAPVYQNFTAICQCLVELLIIKQTPFFGKECRFCSPFSSQSCVEENVSKLKKRGPSRYIRCQTCCSISKAEDCGRKSKPNIGFFWQPL